MKFFIASVLLFFICLAAVSFEQVQAGRYFINAPRNVIRTGGESCKERGGKCPSGSYCEGSTGKCRKRDEGRQ